MPIAEENPGAGNVGQDRRRRRRWWSDAQKRQIVAETQEPGFSVPMVAQRYNLNANQIFRWRRLFRELESAGEDVTETLEMIPRRWKVIQTVREKFTCRDCERISQPPAPFHATPRGWTGPNLLATILFEKYGQHVPLNRQRDRRIELHAAHPPPLASTGMGP